MLALIARRLVFALVTLSIVSVVVFTAVEMLPGDMATAYLGRDATPESLALLREEFDLNRPAYVRFFDWLGHALQGDFGMSMARREAINDLISIRLRNTLLLGISASLIGIPLAILLGVMAGLTRDRWPDIRLLLCASATARTKYHHLHLHHTRPCRRACLC
jgi:peptide/nickel transport system permease protein